MAPSVFVFFDSRASRTEGFLTRTELMRLMPRLTPSELATWVSLGICVQGREYLPVGFARVYRVEGLAEARDLRQFYEDTMRAVFVHLSLSK